MCLFDDYVFHSLTQLTIESNPPDNKLPIGTSLTKCSDKNMCIIGESSSINLSSLNSNLFLKLGKFQYLIVLNYYFNLEVGQAQFEHFSIIST